MSKETIGAFTFRNEGDGCLTSKYLEHAEATPYTECCKREKGSNDVFEGEYKTTWLQIDGNYTAKLSINRSGDVYHLYWSDLNSGSIVYEGTAMLFEGSLVGTYWNP
ncbi:hypothetical protein [Chitinophaga polysaccharea]|uniref:hypothetical protein n=1 Tax=Chitinophaga polysaccharea TaxID=1293035 RepID=UPI00115A813E|nr:hypothetical protein [Chitinophaga polysaccharea]